MGESNDFEDRDYTLILHKRAFIVNKKKLATSSCYFKSLFSNDFRDSKDNEHKVNYDITETTLKYFVKWVEDEETVESENILMKKCLERFSTKDFPSLIQLLQLSTVFIVDDLTHSCYRIILMHWLIPERIIDIWLISQILCFSELEDLAFSICLERFEEIPMSSLYKLTNQQLVKFLYSVHLKCTKSYLLHILEKWNQRMPESNQIMDFDISKVLPSKRATIPCIVGRRTIKNISDTCLTIFTWDGKELTEIFNIENETTPFESDLIGMRFISRGVNIYFIGGEQGIGTGRFNNVVWRYCLIGRRWYSVAKLPVQRRHMVVEILGDEIIIVGGVGKHRIKSNKVDLINMYTGQLRDGADLITNFCDVPLHCVTDNKLVIVLGAFYIYDLNMNEWQLIPFFQSLTNIDAIAAYKDFILLCHMQSSSEVQISKVTKNFSSITTVYVYSVCPTPVRYLFEGSVFVNDDDKLLCFTDTIYETVVEIITFNETNLFKRQCKTIEKPQKYETLLRYNFQSGYFHIIHLDTLYDQVPH